MEIRIVMVLNERSNILPVHLPKQAICDPQLVHGTMVFKGDHTSIVVCFTPRDNLYRGLPLNIYIYIHIYIHTYIYIYTYIYIHIYIYVRVCVRT